MKLPEKVVWDATAMSGIDAYMMDTLNQLIDYLKEREYSTTIELKNEITPSVPLTTFQQTIIIPKPEWWDDEDRWRIREIGKVVFLDALEACSKASGITFNLE